MKHSYNPLALTGHGINDDEYISDWNSNSLISVPLDPSLAYTKELPLRVIDIQIQDGVDSGELTPDEAVKERTIAINRHKKLLASKGLLK